MHPCFIDIAAAYAADAPYKGALGGTQSAVCYVSAELVKAGVPVTLLNQSREKTDARGVRTLPPEALDSADALKEFSHLVFNGRWSEKLVKSLRKKTSVPFIGWMHEACFQSPYVLPLEEFSSFVFVSDWQKNLNAPRVPPHAKSHVIPNGIAPSFHDLAKTESGAPIALYAGSSKRGLLFLPAIIPLVHKTRPDLRFEIYGDVVIGTDEAANQTFHKELEALPNIDHVGPVDQTTLATRMTRAAFLLSPNTYPETFCIVLAEALAAGLYVIATNRAALPNTAGGFATLMEVEGKDDPNWRPEGLNPETFASFAAHEMEGWLKKPAAEKAAHIAAQQRFARTRYDWKTHAARWMDVLKNA